MGYDLFTPIDFQIQPKEQKTVFIDLAIVPREGYYAQLMSKSGLTVLYELEVKAGVIDPDFTGNIGVVLNFGPVPFVPWGTSRRVGRSKNIHNEKASTFHDPWK